MRVGLARLKWTGLHGGVVTGGWVVTGMTTTVTAAAPFAALLTTAMEAAWSAESVIIAPETVLS